jgi:hypothetical protein
MAGAISFAGVAPFNFCNTQVSRFLFCFFNVANEKKADDNALH